MILIIIIIMINIFVVVVVVVVVGCFQISSPFYHSPVYEGAVFVSKCTWYGLNDRAYTALQGGFSP